MTSDSRPHASPTVEPTRSARLTRYGAAAAFAGLGSGGAAVASVVTSSSVGWSGWTGVVASVNGTLNNTAFGTALLNGGFRFSMRQWVGVDWRMPVPWEAAAESAEAVLAEAP